jgi:hypothetical protein
VRSPLFGSIFGPAACWPRRHRLQRLFTYPESPAFKRYPQLYCATVAKRGGDPNIGGPLPILVKQAGFVDIGVSVAQPLALEGETKLLNAITMQNIAGAILTDGLASEQEIEDVVRELYEFAANPDTVAGVPRVVQVWGRRQGSEVRWYRVGYARERPGRRACRRRVPPHRAARCRRT